MLYLWYFPRHLKYQRTLPLDDPPHTGYGSTNGSRLGEGHIDQCDGADVIEERVDGYRRPVHTKLDTTPEWRLAVTLAWVVALHLYVYLPGPARHELIVWSRILLFILTAFLLVANAPWKLRKDLALFLGLSGTLLAILQYAPQIYKTYRAGLVGALSLGTMCIQVPGSILFVISIAIRPGTNWTSWIPYAVTGAMQGALLVNPPG